LLKFFDLVVSPKVEKEQKDEWNQEIHNGIDGENVDENVVLQNYWKYSLISLFRNCLGALP